MGTCLSNTMPPAPYQVNTPPLMVSGESLHYTISLLSLSCLQTQDIVKKSDVHKMLTNTHIHTGSTSVCYGMCKTGAHNPSHAGNVSTYNKYR